MKNRRFENPTVHDPEGKNVTAPDQVYQIVEDYFQKQFYQPNEIAIERFVGEPRPLQNPLTGPEIYKAIKSMSNNKAYVKVPVELIKYAPSCVHDKTAEVLNNIFAKHQDIPTGNADLDLEVKKINL